MFWLEGELTMIELEEVYSDISPWKQGDILMRIDGSDKLVVVGGGNYHYGVWPLLRVYNMKTRCVEDLEKSTADWLYVKVGTYDFENSKEVDEDAAD